MYRPWDNKKSTFSVLLEMQFLFCGGFRIVVCLIFIDCGTFRVFGFDAFGNEIIDATFRNFSSDGVPNDFCLAALLFNFSDNLFEILREQKSDKHYNREYD